MFKLLPHTADIRLLALGDDAEELFRSALDGMNYLLKKEACKQQNGSFIYAEEVRIKATDMTSLLIDFLSEVLTLSQINKVIYCAVSFHNLSGNELSATVRGNAVNVFEEDIKAVTYHEAEILPGKKKNLETIIIFDI